MVTVNVEKVTASGAAFIVLQNEEVKVTVTNIGCHLLSIKTKDRDGKMGDIILGYASEEECLKDTTYLGSFVGRFANRIARGRFTLNGKEYQLAVNNGVNHLHGGIEGFHRKMYDYELLEDGIRFHRVSPDGEEGYPGNLMMDVVYRLDENQLWIEYDAEADQDTLVNFTTHTYFNLTAGKESIHNHQLQIAADTYAAIDETGIPTGEFPKVAGTPFDFLNMHAIGERIEADDEQIRRGTGYDHPFVLSSEKDQAVLYEPGCGRQVIISTSLPMLQVYTGNYLDDCISSKWGRQIKNRDAVAIEAEYLPDSVNQEENSKTILRKGEHYHQWTVYRFEAE